MTPTPTPAKDATWFELKECEWRKEDNSKYDEYKNNLRKNIKKLKKTVSFYSSNHHCFTLKNKYCNFQ